MGATSFYKESIYLDLEDTEDRRELTEPDLFWKDSQTKGTKDIMMNSKKLLLPTVRGERLDGFVVSESGQNMFSCGF